MNKALVRRWITALRSGKYKQAQRRMRRETGYCCMGVAGDLLTQYQRPRARWRRSVIGEWSLIFQRTGKEDSYELPIRELPQFGLTPDDQSILVGMNDTGEDFDTIADRIEKITGVTVRKDHS